MCMLVCAESIYVCAVYSRLAWWGLIIAITHGIWWGVLSLVYKLGIQPTQCCQYLSAKVSSNCLVLFLVKLHLFLSLFICVHVCSTLCTYIFFVCKLIYCTFLHVGLHQQRQALLWLTKWWTVEGHQLLWIRCLTQWVAVLDLHVAPSNPTKVDSAVGHSARTADEWARITSVGTHVVFKNYFDVEVILLTWSTSRHSNVYFNKVL